ncbi:MAG: TonB-dependent receptor [Bacteroidaceae bacterium]|nr:TonB-dependent receptor [Bacteroidaceae bacterium]
MVKRSLIACVLTSTLSMQAQSQQDSISKVHELQEVAILGLRANKTTPVAYSELNKQQIQEMNKGKDIPFLLSMTPSVTISSDAGNGVGYTGIHVRGTDPSRVNVTANGIPVNDAESSQVYWVNMPDFASSMESVQIQRGVGTSTNGSGAFGATVSMETEKLGGKPYLSYDQSAGSYNTHKETLKFGTGLLNGHWAMSGRLSHLGSDGYLDRASTRLNSYFFQVGYLADNTMVKFVTFNGEENTYHAWNYASKYEQSLYGRTYNSCGEYKDANGNKQYYKDQTDNYHQQHYQLLLDQNIATMFKLNVGLHYTRGDGYYEEYKKKRSLAEYGLSNIIIPTYDEDGNVNGTKTVETADLIRRKQMGNDFFGFVSSLNFDNKDNITATLGGGWNKYVGDHWGNVLWVRNYTASLEPNFEYYRNKAVKYDGNIYAKGNWEIFDGFNTYLDLQYRHTSIDMNGCADWWLTSPEERMIRKYDFFNPKFGIFYKFNENNNVYASVAVGHKEPTRNDFEDNYGKELKAEQLIDWEVGYKFSSEKFTAGVNLYYMDYKNQFVLTGELNSIGEMIAKNSGKSFRMGAEFEAAYQPVDWFRWDVNATLSRNRNIDYTVEGTNSDWSKIGSINLGDTPISFSPDFIFNNRFTFSHKGFRGQIQSQYIGEQYMTNTGFKSFVANDDYGKEQTIGMTLGEFFTTNIDLAYTFKFRNTIKSLTVGCTIYNVFSKEYDNNGWAYCEIGKDANGNAYAWSSDVYEAGFAPSAPCHFMANLSINF